MGASERVEGTVPATHRRIVLRGLQMDPDDFDHDAWQALRQAIRRDDLNAVSELLASKPELVGLNTTLGSCLHFAASKGRLAIVLRLV